MLRDFKIPYFRMSSCAHRNDVFEGWDKQRTIELAARAIRTIKTYCSYGVGISFRQDRFRELVPRTDSFSSLYELLVWQCLTAIATWAKVKLQTGHNEVGYFFEAGHKHAGKAAELMSRVLTEDNFTVFQSSGFGFVRKEQCLGAQAADLLAWQLLQEADRKAEGKESRKDFVSLCEADHYIIFVNDALIQGLAEAVRRDNAIASSVTS